MLMHDLEVLCNEPWCCILCWQFDMQFSYATHLAQPVLCRPTHFNISGYASALAYFKMTFMTRCTFFQEYIKQFSVRLKHIKLNTTT